MTSKKYSLNQLLNTQTQMQPQLYQHLIHQLKSPLQSIPLDITQDNSYSYQPQQQVPRRPNIPPPPRRGVQMDMGKTYRSVIVAQGVKDETMQRLLSPLDTHVFEEKSETKRETNWCLCGVEESDLKQDRKEIDAEEYQRFKNMAPLSPLKYEQSYPRSREHSPQFKVQTIQPFEVQPQRKAKKKRPIFQQVTLRPGTKIGMARYTKSYGEVSSNLKKQHQSQLGQFVGLLGQLQQSLCNLHLKRQQVQKYLQLIYQKMSQNTGFAPQIDQSQDLHRIMHRLQCRNTSQALSRLLKKRPQKNKEQAQHRLNQLFNILHSIQKTISHFLTNQNSLFVLNIAYHYLNNNFTQQTTFFGQLQAMTASMGLGFRRQGMELIWRGGESKLLSQRQFLQGLAMSDLIVRVPQGFQQDLQKKGFSRNV